MPPLVLSDDEVYQLQALAHSRSLPHSIVQRAQIVLACDAGETNTSIAKRMGLTVMTVGKWRKRYRDLGLEDLHDELRPGRPRTYEDDKVAEVINRVLQTKAEDGNIQWSARSLAPATGISKTTVHRWLQTFSGAPPAKAFQALHPFLLCREGPRHHWPVPESARQSDGALR
jgi:putative transposase